MASKPITIRVERQHIRRFFSLLESGFWVATRPGTTITDLVVTDLAVDRDYLKNDIQTIFFNGRPVDDPDTAPLAEGDRVAFSASMPGLLGATMRKGGFYKAMRQSISFNPHPHARPTGTQNIWVMVKCFNLVARELAPHLLSQGIWIETEGFVGYLKRRILSSGIKGVWQSQSGISGPLSDLAAEIFPPKSRQYICFPDAIDLKP